MVMIRWQREPKEKRVAEAVAPGNKQKLPFKDAEHMVRAKARELGDKNMRSWLYYIKPIIKHPNEDIALLTFGEVANRCKKLNSGTARHARSRFGSILGFCLTGKISRIERSQPSAISTENGEIQINAKFKAASIDVLSDLMVRSGKHLEFVTKALDAIQDCPLEELRVIEGTEILDKHKKMRNSIRTTANKAIAPKGWTMMWSNSRKVFFVVRKEALQKFKKGAK